MKANSLLLIITLAFAPTVMASNWISLVKGTESEVFIDIQSLVFDGDQRTVWVKYVYKHLQKVGDTKKTYSNYTSYEGFFCTSRRLGVYEEVFYDKVGQVVYSTVYDSSPSWEPVVPDSNGELTLTAVCAMKPSLGNSATSRPQPTSAQPEQVTPPHN